mgnify:CR=1 FL=1
MPCNRQTYVFYHGSEVIGESLAHSEAEAVEMAERQARICTPGAWGIGNHLSLYVAFGSVTVKILPCNMPCKIHTN